MPTWPDGMLVLALVALALGLVSGTLRMLVLHPAPAFRRLSLRRRALHALRPESRTDRWRLRRQQSTRHLRSLRALAYLGALCLLWLPITLAWGPLDSEDQSRRYLETMWQVVAAALGVSVAMVAFAFEAFSSSRQRTYGTSLREFAYSSSLVFAIEVGLLSLALDGIVLFEPLHLEAKGWPAAIAMAMSAITLLAVGLVLHLILRLLDDRALDRMRRERVDQLLQRVMAEQLIGQAAGVWLDSSGLPIARAILTPTGTTPTYANRTGEVHDVHLGSLARWVMRQRATPNGERRLSLVAVLGAEVSAGRALLHTWAEPSDRGRRRLRRAIRIRRSRADQPDRALSDLLGTLHQQAMEAARGGREHQWNEISEAYERVLLGLPRAAAGWGIPFAGAVATPGFFGQGPVERIADFIYEELVAAVDGNSRELIDPISYFPLRIAQEATRLGAPEVARPMLRLYVEMYRLARRT